MSLTLYNSRLFALMCGGLTSLLSAAVLFGWATHNQALIQVLPHFAPMQFNTALGFLLAGFGLISLASKRDTLALIFGIGCLLLGGTTLIQYVTGINFGIDELFMDAHVIVKTSQPGRMAPSTALSFALVGLTLIIGHRNRQLQISLATSVIVLSLLAFFGYLTNVDGIYGWGNLTRMAIHTASAFLVLGVGIIFLGVFEENNKKVDLWNLVPLTLSSIVLVLSLFSWYGIKEATHVRNIEYFDRLVSDTNDLLLKRYTLYEHSLLGGVGFFSASDTVRRDEWKAYVDALNIETTLPGIAGIGYIAAIQSEDLPEYLREVRLDGSSDFENHPETTHPDKFIITYIEPQDINEKAVGLDIGFESNRRAAAELARDYGLHTLTEKIVLVQDGQRTPGFLLLVPFYDTNSVPDTVQQRREQFRGWVYAPFIASNFLRGLTDSSNDQVAFNVYDGESTTPEALIYSTGPYVADKSAYETQTKLNLAERQWTINWYATDKYAPIANQNLSTIVLVLGLLGSAILYLTLLQLLRSKHIIAREVDKKTALLAGSEQRLQLVFDNAGEGILGIDRNGHITFANRAAQALLGYSFAEMQGKSQHSLIQYKHLDGTLYDTADSNIVSTITTGETCTEAEEVFWHKNGAPISVEYTSKPIKEENGFYSGAVVIFRDIADRKAAEAEVKQANAELEEFAYRTSHDLRSPLVSSITLLGIAETAIREDNTSKALASLSHTQTSLRKLEELVKDILVLTQTKNELEEEQAIDLRALIESALDTFRYMDNFDRLDIQLDMRFTDTLITKKNRVSLIVENLISNAVKYQDPSKDDSFIKISTYKSGHNFIMAVQDNGLGVPKDQQHNLFKMFKRFHPRTSFGSGLGLYMMQKSVSILGGEIHFADPGDGSVFKFSIPLTS